MKAKATYSLLYELYCEKGMSTREIAIELGYSSESHKSVRKLLRDFGISIRTKSQAYHISIQFGKEPATFEPGYTPWNKGITAKDDPRIVHGLEQSARMREIGNTPEERQKRSERFKGKPKSKEHCQNISKGRKGIQFSKEHREHIRQAVLMQKPKYFDTCIEVAMQDELRHRNIHFETHIPIKGKQGLICRPDIVFPRVKLAVFCDGLYWHSMPHTLEKDRRQECQLKESSWHYLRFTDEQINRDVSACIDEIIAWLSGRNG